MQTIDKTINVLWSTVVRHLVSSEQGQWSAIGPHIAPIDLGN